MNQIELKLEFSDSADFSDGPGPNSFDITVGKTDKDLITFIVQHTKRSHSIQSAKSIRKARSVPLPHYSGKNIFDMVNFSAFASLNSEYSLRKKPPPTPSAYKPVTLHPTIPVPQAPSPISSRFSNITYSKSNSSPKRRRLNNSPSHIMQTRTKSATTRSTRSKSISLSSSPSSSSSSSQQSNKKRKKCQDLQLSGKKKRNKRKD